MISITLPSIYPHCLASALDNIHATTKGKFEVLVVSPFVVRNLNNVTWVHEHTPRGCAYAHAAAAQYARGNYLVPFADDHEFVDGWDVAAIKEFEERCQVHPFALGLRGAHSGHVGTNFGIYYPYFPLMLTSDVKRVGWIGKDYEQGFGDSDLAMRIWDAGGRCEWSAAGFIRPTASDKRKEYAEGKRPSAAYTENDQVLFVERWTAKGYGKGWGWEDINDFNVDLRPEENTHLTDGNTIYQNDPSFLEQVVRMTS